MVAVIALLTDDLSITLAAALFCLTTYLISLKVERASPDGSKYVSLWPPFLIAFFFYNNTYPFVLLNGVDLIYPGLETSKEYTTIANTQAVIAFAIMCSFATVDAWCKRRYRLKPPLILRNNQPTTPTWMAVGTNILFLCVSVSYFTTIAGEISAEVGRVDVAQKFNLYFWVFLGWMHILFYFGALIKKSKSQNNTDSRNQIMVATLALAAYCAMDAALGGRKIIAAALLGTIYSALRFGIPRTHSIILAVPIIILAASVRAIFYDKFAGEADGFASIVFQLGGEFVFTFLTFPTAIASECRFYESGISSYLMTILQFVPRIFWDEKPFSLAQSLSNYLYNSQEGFSIVPMAEAWCNFRQAAGLVFPLVIAVMFNFLGRISNRLPIIGFIVYAHALELNRGEISYLIFQVITLYAIYEISGRLATTSLRTSRHTLC